VTIAMVVALAASSVALLFGASNPGGILDVLDGRTWLRSDDGLLLANNASGKIDFKLQAHGVTGDVRVVQNGRRSVLLDSRNGTLGAIDLSRYRVVNPSKVGSDVDVVPAGTDVFVIHKTTGIVELRDALTNEKLASIKIDGKLTRGVVDSDGTLFVADETNGLLRSVARSGEELRVEDSVAVAPRGHDLDIGLLNGEPVVLDIDGARLVVVVDGDAQDPIDLPLQSGDKPQLARVTDGPVLPVAVNDTGSLVLVRDGRGTRVELPDANGHELGEPVPYRDTIYVPDYTSGKVHLVDQDGASLTAIEARNGPGTYDVFVNEGTLFINDPDGNATIVGPDGTPHPIDKGDPDIPTNTDPPSEDAPPAPTPEPKPTPTPAAGESPIEIAAGAPGAPLSPSATGENTATTVSWGAAESHGAAVTNYMVTCTSSNGGPSASKDAGAGLSTRVDGLKNGKSYTCAVHAVNSAGPGPDATTPVFKPTGTEPYPMSAPSADPADRQITVQYSALSEDQMNGLEIDGYRVVCTPDSGPPVSKDVGANETSVVVDAVNGATYKCRVGALVGTTVVGTLSQPSQDALPYGAPSSVSVSLVRISDGPRKLRLSVPAASWDGQAGTIHVDVAGLGFDFDGSGGNADFDVPWDSTSTATASACVADRTPCASATSNSVAVARPTFGARWVLDAHCVADPNGVGTIPGDLFHIAADINLNGMDPSWVSNPHGQWGYGTTGPLGYSWGGGSTMFGGWLRGSGRAVYVDGWITFGDLPESYQHVTGSEPSC
jgi:hypothetical protein